MKSELLGKEQQTQSYPWLGIFREDRDFIVLFRSEEEGVVVWSAYENYPVGHFSRDWDQSDFTTYDGGITLSN